MSHVFHQLYYHFACATHSREPLIDRTWRPQLLEIINQEVYTRGGFPLRHNAMPDHAHLLCRLPPTIVVADFIGQLKGATLRPFNGTLGSERRRVFGYREQAQDCVHPRKEQI